MKRHNIFSLLWCHENSDYVMPPDMLFDEVMDGEEAILSCIKDGEWIGYGEEASVEDARLYDAPYRDVVPKSIKNKIKNNVRQAREAYIAGYLDAKLAKEKAEKAADIEWRRQQGVKQRAFDQAYLDRIATAKNKKAAFDKYQAELERRRQETWLIEDLKRLNDIRKTRGLILAAKLNDITNHRYGIFEYNLMVPQRGALGVTTGTHTVSLVYNAEQTDEQFHESMKPLLEAMAKRVGNING